MKRFFVMVTALLLSVCFVTSSVAAVQGDGIETAVASQAVVSGDVNGDGVSNSLDAALVLKYDALIIDTAEINVSEGDINGDYTTNNLDAALILKYDAGLITDYKYAVPTMEYFQFELNSNKDSYKASCIPGLPAIARLLIYPSSYNGLPVTKISCINKTAKEIYIPEGVLEIGDYSFLDNPNLEKITIPSTVLRIGEIAFKNLPNLKTLDFYADNLFECKADLQALPNRITYSYNGVRYLGNPDNRYLYALQGDVFLEEAILHEDTKVVGPLAFFGTYTLEKVATPSGLKVICDRAFLNCINVTEITLHEGLVAVMDSAFSGCNEVNISVPNSVMYAAGSAFPLSSWNAHGEYLYVGNTDNPYRVLVGRSFDDAEYKKIHPDTKIIAETALSATSGKAELPEGLLVICDRAFYEFAADDGNISIPSTVIFIGEEAFNDCQMKNDLVLPEGLRFLGERAFCDTEIKSVDIRYKLDYIPSGAFKDCTSLKKINFPQGLRIICDSAFELTRSTGSYTTEQLVFPEGLEYIGEYAFSCRRPLDDTTLNIPNSVVYIGTKAFGNETASNPQNGYKYINIGSSLETIPYSAFSNSTIESIDIPENITAIEISAFQACPYLKVVHVSENLKTLELFAFAKCPALTDVYYKGTKAEWDAIEKTVDGGGNGWNYCCPEITVHCSDGDIVMPENNFSFWR